MLIACVELLMHVNLGNYFMTQLQFPGILNKKHVCTLLHLLSATKCHFKITGKMTKSHIVLN